MPRLQRITGFSLLAFSLSFSGCASVDTLSNYPQSPQIFGGLRGHVEGFPYGHLAPLTSGGHGGMGVGILAPFLIPLIVIDLPLSLSIDAVALPVTIPGEIYWWSSGKEAHEQALKEASNQRTKQRATERSNLTIQRAIAALDSSNEKDQLSVTRSLKRHGVPHQELANKLLRILRRSKNSNLLMETVPALEKTGSGRVEEIQALTSTLKSTKSIYLQRRILRALAGLGKRAQDSIALTAQEEILQLLKKSKEPMVAHAALLAACQLTQTTPLKKKLANFLDKTSNARNSVQAVLFKEKTRQRRMEADAKLKTDVIPTLKTILNVIDPNNEGAILTLLVLGEKPSIPSTLLQKVIREETSPNPSRELYLVVKSTGQSAALPLAELLDAKEEPGTRRRAAFAIRHLGRDAQPALPQILTQALRGDKEKDLYLRTIIISCLETIGIYNEQVRSALDTLEKDSNPRVKQQAVTARKALER